MDKTAQKRSILNQLREKVNMPGSYLEGFFKPELDRVMTSLKSLDDRIRSELTGKQIGTADAPAIATSSKDLLKMARTAFNRREYISGVSDLAMFHKKMQNVVNDIDKFFVDVNKIHHKFLFEGVEDEKVKRLREHMENKTASLVADQLLKQAGLVDFLLNIGTKRGRGLAAWEKKYPKETKALREGGVKLLDQADTLLANTISILKEMATARAIRRPDDYMDAANKIKGEFNKFDSGDKGFKSYYQTAIMPWMKIKDEIDSKNTPPAPVGPTGQSEVGTNPPPAPPSAPPPSGPSGPAASLPPGASPPFTPAPVEEQAPDTERTPAVQAPLPNGVDPGTQVRVAPGDPKVRVAHSQFFKSLESMGQEDPIILSGYISKYAKSIQGNDPETAIALFSILKKLKG
jgi:hypothetical protein